MKTLKQKFFCFIACIAVVLSFSVFALGIGTGQTTTAYAAEIEADSSENITPEEIPEAEPEVENHTIFSRMYEWVTDHKTEIITAVGDVILVIMLIIEKAKSKKSYTAIGSQLLSIGKGVYNTETSQNNVVGVTNELIAGYNKFEQTLNSFDEKEDERQKTAMAAYIQTRAILKILVTVYANSKNVPQGVKDLVNLEYADVLKLVGNEETLKQLVDSTAVQSTEESAAATAEEKTETEV